MIDIAQELKGVHREVRKRPGTGEGSADEPVRVLLRRRLGAAVDDVWSTLTDPERLPRWFLPVNGDLRAGGTFELEGGVNGEILRCDRPYLLDLTWGAETSVVELRLAPDENGDTVIELEHTLAADATGPLDVGPGWDVTLLHLDQHVRGIEIDLACGWETSEDVQKFAQHAVSAWASATENSGTATTEEITAATRTALERHAPDLT